MRKYESEEYPSRLVIKDYWEPVYLWACRVIVERKELVSPGHALDS